MRESRMSSTSPNRMIMIDKKDIRKITSKTNSSFCHIMNAASYHGLDGRSGKLENYDTIDKDDAVRQHYSLLPYPEVSASTLNREKQHYNGENRNVPLGITSQITLESLNHYLFKGGNDFR